ncbi:MAG TPA: extracellular solute-binding protein [Methylomirabilota bacterium]|nr:extracellular solute-binding protein [Methylomirabilota bacterium]
MTRPMTRRRLIGGLGSVGLGALAAPSLIRSAYAQDKTLNIWSYSGFITDDFRQEFEEATGIRLNIRLVSDQGEQYNLMVSEGGSHSADIVCVAGHRFYQFVDAGLLEPIDLDRLPSWSEVEEEYAVAEWVSRRGQIWGVPLVVVSSGLIYNSNEMEAPESLAVMFDPANAGKTTYQIQDFFPLVMNYLGYDGSARSYAHDHAIAQRAVDATRDFLIDHKDKVRRYYDAATEVQQMLVNGDVRIAAGSSGPAAQLILDGFPAGYTIPREGGLAYAYGFNIAANAANLDNAYTFLNALLSSAENGAGIVRSTGYNSAIKGAEALLTDAERSVLTLSSEERARLSWVDVETAAFIFDLIDTAAEEIRAA